MGNELAKGTVDIHCRPGCTLSKANELVQEHYFLHHGGQPIYSGHTYYYIIAGICDITKKIKIYKDHYEETVYLDHPADTVDKIVTLLSTIQADTLDLGAKPVICPLYPIDLATWNQVRYKQHKTKTLKYLESYDEMRLAIEEVILTLNKKITNLNSNIQVSTPMIHKSMLHNHRKGKQYWQYHKLVDGCHPGAQMTETIAKSLAKAIQRNEN